MLTQPSDYQNRWLLRAVEATLRPRHLLPRNPKRAQAASKKGGKQRQMQQHQQEGAGKRSDWKGNEFKRYRVPAVGREVVRSSI